MFVKADSTDQRGSVRVKTRCPKCGQNGTFDQIGADVFIHPHFHAGFRRCPDPTCHNLLAIIARDNGIIASFPPIRFDFDPSGIPEKILKAMDEAVTCHAHSCYIAAAIMIRKTLEEICADKAAKGGNLKEKIVQLGKSLLIPQELLTAMDALRLLGNDAAHIESQVFARVSSEEVSIGLEFTREILKATYQYDQLLARLKALQKPTP